MRIVYIVGDGRSGSTVLESILSNIEGAISVGECFRFWERFYKNETLCGCGVAMADCAMWSKVHSDLSKLILDYDPAEIQSRLKKFLLFRNFRNIRRGDENTEFFLSLAGNFYQSIVRHSGSQLILDSSKSPSWARLLLLLPGFDVKVIHLERALPGVASSWKKKIVLPEFIKKEVFMPQKTNLSILRTWLRVKWLSSRLSDSRLLFVRFERFCNDQKQGLRRIFKFLELPEIKSEFLYRTNHGIAGNPLRMSGAGKVEIHPIKKGRPKNISIFEFQFFRFVDAVANILVK